MADDGNQESDEYESSGTPAQEFFPIPTDIKCPQVLASFNANVPPVYKPNLKDDFYTRNVVKRSKVHQIKNLTQRPVRSVPPNALNTWRDLTPDVKLPDLRRQTQGQIYYTRGKLCEKLHRSKPEFDLSDPVNKRKVLERETYSALHDPHCKSYFRRPTVNKHLRNQKLINSKNEVLCDVHEFNKFRSYLGELFNDQVKRRIGDSNANEDMERGILKALCAKQRSKEMNANKAFQLRHREMNMSYRQAQRNRYIANIQKWKTRLQQIDTYRSHVKLAYTGMYTMKHWNAFLTRQKAATAEERRKQHTLIRIAYAETKNDYVTKYDKFVRLALFERYKADQVAVMIARDDQIDDMEGLVEETLKRTRAGWLRKYDTFIEHVRENPLSHYNYMVKSQEIKKFLMKKYFYKWIRYIIKQREQRPNEAHLSVFEVDRKLKPFVNSLRELSPSDFEQDDKVCGAGDNACRTKKLIKKDKLTNLAKMFPNRELENNKPNFLASGSRASNIPAIANKVEGNTSAERRKKMKKKINKQKEEEDGNEADIEEPDDFIDKMVARFKHDQEELRKKLQSVPPSRMPTIGNRYHVRKEFLNNLDSENPLDDTQEDQKETITFLKDINRVVSSNETKKGWRAMKL